MPTASNALNLFYTYKFLKLLTQKWKDMEAFKEGIIDEHGNIITPVNKRTDKQKNVLDRFTLLVINLKKIIEKFPLGKSTIAKYAVALKLIREEYDSDIFENILMESNFTGGVDMGGASKGAMPLFEPDDEWMNHAVFDVDPDVYHKSRFGKDRYVKFKTYTGKGELGDKITDYAKKNPKRGIILKNKQDGHMIFLRRNRPNVRKDT